MRKMTSKGALQCIFLVLAAAIGYCIGIERALNLLPSKPKKFHIYLTKCEGIDKIPYFTFTNFFIDVDAETGRLIGAFSDDDEHGIYGDYIFPIIGKKIMVRDYTKVVAREEEWIER